MNSPITEFVLIRHGETAWNVAGRMQGHLDVPLNDLGLKQAEAVGRRLANEHFDAIYSSDLSRALQTIAALAQVGKAVRREPRLRERHYGVLQGLTGNEAAAYHGELWDQYRSRHPDVALHGGGESLRQFYDRIVSLIKELHALHQGQRLLLVTHGGVLDAAYRHATQMPLHAVRTFPIRNASINVLHHTDAQWHVAKWGDITHLPSDALDGD